MMTWMLILAVYTLAMLLLIVIAGGAKLGGPEDMRVIPTRPRLMGPFFPHDQPEAGAASARLLPDLLREVPSEAAGEAQGAQDAGQSLLLPVKRAGETLASLGKVSSEAVRELQSQVQEVIAPPREEPAG